MKITIIGSTQYLRRMMIYASQMESKGHKVRLPFFDEDMADELELAERNRENIEWADEIHIFWDGRSSGTILDFGIAFGLRKPIKIIFLEEKTIAGIMRKYERKNDTL